jgi:chromosomal replication initiation ATPase DnaA
MYRIGDIKEKTKEQAVVFDDCKVLADDENDDDAVVRLYRALDMAGQIGHPQGDRFEAHRQTFENLLYTRNHSILAHGLTPIKADTAASFRQKMTKIFLDAPLIRFPQELHW